MTWHDIFIPNAYSSLTHHRRKWSTPLSLQSQDAATIYIRKVTNNTEQKLFHLLNSTDFIPLISVYWFYHADIPDTGLLCDLLWADPDKDIVGWGENDRGVSFTFGEDVVAQFLRRYVRYDVCKFVEGTAIGCVCVSLSMHLLYFFLVSVSLSDTISLSLSLCLCFYLTIPLLIDSSPIDNRIWFPLEWPLSFFLIRQFLILFSSLHFHGLLYIIFWFQTRFRSYLSGTPSSGGWVRVLR